MATETTTVQAIHTLEAWTQQLDAANASGKLVVVDFTASWCGPCRAIAPSFADFSKKYPHVVFLKVDVDERQEIAGEWKVEAMPTFVFLKNGVEVGRIVGADKKKLEAKIQELCKE